LIKKTLFIFFALLCSNMFAQQQVTDSLHNKLATSKNASEKLESYISLASQQKHQSPIEGKKLLTLAKAIAIQLKDTVHLFKIAEIEADIYYILGETEKEISVIKDAVLLVQQYKNKQLEARALKLLGNAYSETSDYDKQLNSYLKSFTIAEKLQDTTLLVSLYNNIGNVYKDLKMYKKSLENYEKGLHLQTQSSLPISKSIAGILWGNSGIVYEQLGNYKEALRRVKIAKNIRVALKNWGQIGGSNIDIANVYEKLQQLDSAIFYNKQGVFNYKKIQNKGGLLVGYENLARLYEKQHLFKTALNYRKREDSLRGLVMNSKTLKKQAYLLAEIEYEKEIGALNIEKKNLQQTSFNRLIIVVFIFLVLMCSIVAIIFIRKKNIKSKEINKVLSASNREKEILLKEVHHRVKNNLQLVSSLLSLQSKTINNKKIKQILLESTDRIKSMSLVHQRLYEREAFTEVEFQTYSSQIAENLIASYNSSANTCFEINTDENIGIDFAITLGLILNEIITNTLKHNPDQKKLKIELSFVKKKNTYELKVSDNGKGFNIATVQKKNTLGMRLISILTNQLEGELQITSKKDKGVTYTITIPMS
jgi:two-component system, sensor histidine kinase PdtaS